MTPSPNCSIIAMNNRAIGLVKNGECRSAVKLFLQALSTLKSEVVCRTPSACQPSEDSNSDESPFIRVAVKAEQQALGMTTYDCFFALNPKTNSCAPQHRDGTTACILYNMAVAEHKMGLGREQNGKIMCLKKATHIYNMAFSAAQHWKKYTVRHSGCQILSLAILNNLLVIHHELQNDSKVSQLHTLLRDILFCQSKGDEISSQELTLFAKNLSLCSIAPAGSSSNSAPLAQPVLGAFTA